jgi:flagellar hook protein FlgE
MLRSLYSGISGMKNFQTKLDVIGNNIANVNTSGFKKGRITFQDMLSQSQSAAQGAQDGRGGINPEQVGVGSQTGSIDNIQTQGFRQTTNNPLDLMLEGDGMFAVQDGDDTYYTRAGNFYLDNEGNVVNPDGYYLLDVDGDEITIPEDAESFSIQPNGNVIYIEDGEQGTAGQIGVAMFSNPSGLEKAGSNLFINTDNAGLAEALSEPETDGAASIVSGALEMSNVDLAEEFSEMITAQRAFQANTRIITTSDQILEELVNLKR